MDRYHWLVFLHVAGAFMVVAGAVIAGILNFSALRRDRPSEIVVLFRLTRVAVISLMVGMTVALVFGLWLVVDMDFVEWSDAWVIVALILWVVANALGSNGGRRDKRTRQLAERLAAEGDVATPELRAALRDPTSLALSYGSGVAVIAILALMIWKPGS
ncbi:MAG: DUF2269 family protein [Gaiellaceae bacterium]